jgi:8-hydroxy-5-deazaflavin:NADPH oxidoreductase
VLGGHAVTLLGRDEQKAKTAAQELSGDIGAGTVGDKLDADAVVLAVPYDAVDDVLRSYESELDGKVLIDITNPVDLSTFEPLDLDGGSAAEQIAAKAPKAKVAKAFNTTFAGTLLEGQVGGQPLDVFIAADDADAKRAASAIATNGGLRAVDAGPLARARQLEALGFLHMALQEPLGTGFASAVKVIA